MRVTGRFTARRACALLAAQLLPGGVFALWSDDAPDENFMSRLAEVFAAPEAHVVRFHNPLLERDSAARCMWRAAGLPGSGLEG